MQTSRNESDPIMISRNAQNNRKGLIAKIHIAKGKMALDDGSYRMLLMRVTDKDSCSKLSFDQLKKVLDEFKVLGFKDDYRKKRSGTRKMADDEQSKLIRALWISLYHLGKVRDPSEEALTSFVKRMAKVKALQWLSAVEADKVISALRDWMKRAGYTRPDKSHKEIFSMMNERGTETDHANIHVIEAQTRILKMKSHSELKDCLIKFGFTSVNHVYQIPPEEIYAVIEKLGGLIQKQGVQ